MKSYFLCQEDDEKFVVPATSLEEAKEHASMWNAVVIRQLTSAEIANSNPAKGEFAIED